MIDYINLPTRRGVAFLIDLLIILFPYSIALTLIYLYDIESLMHSLYIMNTSESLITEYPKIGFVVLYCLYFIIVEYKLEGRTVGMGLLNIKTTSINGRKVTVTNLIERESWFFLMVISFSLFMSVITEKNSFTSNFFMSDTLNINPFVFTIITTLLQGFILYLLLSIYIVYRKGNLSLCNVLSETAVSINGHLENIELTKNRPYFLLSLSTTIAAIFVIYTILDYISNEHFPRASVSNSLKSAYQNIYIDGLFPENSNINLHTGLVQLKSCNDVDSNCLRLEVEVTRIGYNSFILFDETIKLQRRLTSKNRIKYFEVAYTNKINSCYFTIKREKSYMFVNSDDMNQYNIHGFPESLSVGLGMCGF